MFVDRDGVAIECMACDYGFRAGAGRLYQDRYGEVPGGIVDMVGPAGGGGGRQSLGRVAAPWPALGQPLGSAGPPQRVFRVPSGGR